MNGSCVQNNNIENRKQLQTFNQNGKKMLFSKNTHPRVKQLNEKKLSPMAINNASKLKPGLPSF